MPNIQKSDFRIVATDGNIKDLVNDEIARYGNEADLNHIDVSQVTNMSGVFGTRIGKLGEGYIESNNHTFNGDVSKWDLSNVQYGRGIFHGNETFAQTENPSQLHFLAKFGAESGYPVTLNPKAEEIFSLAKETLSDKSPQEIAQAACNAYQASQSQVSTDSYDYTAALDACDFSSTAESEYTR